jgi:hypothetical protein
MPARIASGSSGQADTTAARSPSSEAENLVEIARFDHASGRGLRGPCRRS